MSGKRAHNGAALALLALYPIYFTAVFIARVMIALATLARECARYARK